MTLVSLSELFEACPETGALLSFGVMQLEHAEAYAMAAEAARRPVIMEISQDTVRYHGGLEPLALATLSVARACDQKVVVQLDHASDSDVIDEAIRLGFTSVMVECPAYDDVQRRRKLREIVARAHAAGVSVESELGEGGSVIGIHDPTSRTDPEAAARFVEETGVDSLAVAVGNALAVAPRSARLDSALVGDIAAKVSVPLALHGSSGVPEEVLINAVVAGIRKVSITSNVNRVFTHAVQDHLLRTPTVDSRAYLGAARKAAAAEAQRLMMMLCQCDRP